MTADETPGHDEFDVVAVIPARMASTRFPGKPLASETGKPMIQHVHEQACRATLVDRVVVATDDRAIHDAVLNFGGEAIMTSAEHPNGTSRIAEAIEGIPCSIVVNVQGDEPMIDPKTIDLAIETLRKDPGALMATVACPFAENEDPKDPNLVKAVRGADGRALTFSREAIPQAGRDGHSEAHRHVGLYTYERDFLPIFAALSPTPMEQLERLEQLRAIEHGHPIALSICPWAHHGIDTPEQYAAFVRLHDSQS